MGKETRLDLYNIWLYIALHRYVLEVGLAPWRAMGWPLKPVGSGSSGVVVEGLLCSLNCDWSAVWLALSLRLMAREKCTGCWKDEADAQWRRRKGRRRSRRVNRWRAPRHFWWRRVPGRCWHCHSRGAGTSCGRSQRTDSLCWELGRESKRRAGSEGELKRRDSVQTEQGVQERTRNQSSSGIKTGWGKVQKTININEQQPTVICQYLNRGKVFQL